MRRKVKTILALLMALALVMSCVGTEGFSVFAENVTASETSSAAETTSDLQAQPSSEAVSTQAAGEKAGSGTEETTGAEASGEDLLYSDGSKDESEGTEGNTLSGNQTPSETAESSETETTEELTTEESSEEETSTESVQETEEAAALPDGAHVPDGYTQQYTVRDKANGFAVTVYAPEGAVPEGAVLSAELLEENDDAYIAAEKALDAETDAALSGNVASTLSESDVDVKPEYDFIALDIHFEDAKGNEVEPSRDVYVVIDATELLPEDADPESVTVQHHAEQDNGNVTVETVADVADITDGVVTVTETEVQNAGSIQAAFTVSGFSAFTITWSKAYNEGADTKLQVIYWDSTNNCELNSPEKPENSELNLKSGDEFQFISDAMPDISGYKFDSARYRSNGDNWVKITAVQATQQEYWFWGWHYSWNWSIQTEDGEKISLDSSRPSIRLYYTVDTAGDTGDSGTVTQNATVSTGKTVIDTDGDYNYDLTLSVTGDRGSSSNRQKVDVLFIMDVSGSMDDTWGTGPNYERKLTSAQNAIYQISGYGNNNGLSDNDALDVRYALITFSGSTSGYGQWDDARNRTNGWVDVNALRNTVGRIRSENGTNYEAGLRIANNTNEIPESTEDTIKVVIFLSDGNPGYYYDSNGYTTGDGSPSDYNPTALSRAVTQCEALDTDYFYFVGVTDSVNGTVFTDMVNAVNVPASNKHAYSSNSTDELMDAFDDIQAQITFFAADHVKMIDPLSAWVDVVPTGQNEQIEFEVKLEQRDADGNYQVVNSETVANGEAVEFTSIVEEEGSTEFHMIPIYDEDTRTITVTFDENYELAPGYRYSVTTTITPNTDAKEAGIDSYDGTGEINTGTHSNSQGFWSNNNFEAKVTYEVTGTLGEEPFPKPVVQVPEVTTTTLTLTKTFNGLSDEEVSYLIFQEDGFGFDVNYCIPQAREDANDGNALTFMAPNSDVEDLKLPDGTSVAASNNGGGGYRIVAGDYLDNKDMSTYTNDSYTDPDTGASLTKNDDGNWVYSITLDVPICKNGYFFTIFEQHQEVPGYAKINDSNAEWTITGSINESGTGKFVDDTVNIYEDMNELGGKGTYREQEDLAIAEGALKRLEITGPTTVSFTNHYTGSLDVTKVIGENNECDEAGNKEYTLTIAPAHPIKIDFQQDSDAETTKHGLAGKTVSYKIVTVADEQETVVEGTKTLDENGSFTISIKPGQIIHFTDMPAIQWQVTEQGYDIEGYTWTGSYSDNNNGVVNTFSHWNRYEETDIIGSSNKTDGIASVDSAVRDIDTRVDADAVALVTVTNSYDRNAVDITVTKTAEDLETPLRNAEFYLYKLDGSSRLYYPANNSSDWTGNINEAKKWISGEDGMFKIEGLEDGTYYLEENKAPDGYLLPETDVSFTISEGVITDTSIDNSEAGSGVNLSVPNTPGYELPATGGTGTTFATIGGLLLMAAAVGSGYGLRRRYIK